MIADYPHIWGGWLSCDLLRGSHDSQSPHIINNYSYHIRGDRSPLRMVSHPERCTGPIPTECWANMYNIETALSQHYAYVILLSKSH